MNQTVAQSRLNISENDLLEDTRPNACRTFVVATSLQATGSVRMTTYPTRTSDPFHAKIWEAARATSAAPTIFAPITIDDIRYGDGGTGWNNPTKEAIAEVHNIWPARKVGCLISIGTGLEEPLQLNDDKPEKIPQMVSVILQKTSSKLLHVAAVAEYCVRCLTSCELVHREVAEHYERFTSEYFRLNVPSGVSKIGLDEWDNWEK